MDAGDGVWIGHRYHFQTKRWKSRRQKPERGKREREIDPFSGVKCNCVSGDHLLAAFCPPSRRFRFRDETCQWSLVNCRASFIVQVTWECAVLCCAVPQELRIDAVSSFLCPDCLSCRLVLVSMLACRRGNDPKQQTQGCAFFLHLLQEKLARVLIIDLRACGFNVLVVRRQSKCWDLFVVPGQLIRLIKRYLHTTVPKQNRVIYLVPIIG